MATPNTVTVVPLWFGAKVTLGGTLAIVGSSELKFTVKPVGGWADRITTNFALDPGLMFSGLERVNNAPHVTLWVTVLYPEALAVMVDEPKSIPHTWTVEVGAVLPG